MAIDSLWSSHGNSSRSEAGLLGMSDPTFVHARCRLFMPAMYFFSGECFMASVHARTELDLQGGRRRLERLEIL